MATLTALPFDRARELAKHYGIALTSIDALEAGSVNSNFRLLANDGGRFFGRLYEEQDLSGAARELDLLAALADAGAQVARPLLRTDGAGPLAEYAGKPFAAFPWIEGESLCFRRATEAHCWKVGQALARVHLASYDATRLGPGRFQPDDMLLRLEHVEREAARPELLPDVTRVRAHYSRYRDSRDATLPTGIVHGDLFRDNVLWSCDEIAALLDFESVFRGPLAYDLAVTLLAWCYGDAFLPERVRAMARGYASVRPFQPNELAAFRNEAALACLRFATSRITDFSLRAPPGEKPARDFRRFLERLSAIEAGALDPALEVLSG